jgi:hypothetical protein
MRALLLSLGLFLLLPFCVSAQPGSLSVESEIRKIDALAADPDVKMVVAAAIADDLQIHRNHLILLRKQTSQSYGLIFVAALRERGLGEADILRRLHALNQEIAMRLDHFSVGSGAEGAPRPVAYLSTGVYHNSAGTFYSLVPEFGIDFSHASLVVGAPYYRTSSTSLSAGGIGDVYVLGSVRGRVLGFDLGSSLTIGTPTGDQKKGLGAGKVSVDAVGTIAKRFGAMRPWLAAGFTNSVFSNVGYQRPYVTDGNAMHSSGGLDFALAHRLTFGLSGFALRPTGAQTVYSQTMQPSATTGNPSQTPGGTTPGGHTPSGMMTPFYEQAQRSVISGSELDDYGAAVWVSIPLHEGLSLNVSAARSVPFHLTTIRAGIGIDVARLLFRRSRF